MDRYIGRANIDHYLSLLNGSDLMPQSRSTITKLLIAEEDKLSHDLDSNSPKQELQTAEIG